MTRAEKAVMLLEWLHNVTFEDGVDTTWFDEYVESKSSVIDDNEETSTEWTSAYMDLYNLKQSILEYQNK